MQELTNEDLFHLFQRDPLGIKVFENLCTLYYDVNCFQADNMYETAYLEGRRSVMMELMIRMRMTEVPENTEITIDK